ncbi:hypothetical protein NW066_01240 [Mycoplasmopsis felis]|uniref:hypothetical protein n=1 Tax=Mycoplasmopsis felis TaxID=33923 RepID=UPI0021B07DAB|nr:hypothetical protein [Mycoplasmopsis felis]UWV85336.1 hypothetical protein NW066_01240 [Mycoplasmopsis felis]
MVSLLEYTNQTMQKSFNQTNEEFIDISERSWLKFAANIEVRLNLYKELKKQLSELKEEEINNPNLGIKSNKFLSLYKYVFGFSEFKFLNYVESDTELTYLSDRVLMFKGLLLNKFLEKKGFSKTTYNQLWEKYEKFIEINQNNKIFEEFQRNNITNLYNSFENQIKQAINETINIDLKNKYQKEFEELLSFIDLVFDFYELFFEKSKNIYIAIEQSFFKTHIFDPILNDKEHQDFLRLFSYIHYNLESLLFNLYSFTSTSKIIYLSNALSNLKNKNFFNLNKIKELENQINTSENLTKSEQEDIYNQIIEILHQPFKEEELFKGKINKINNFVKEKEK